MSPNRLKAVLPRSYQNLNEVFGGRNAHWPDWPWFTPAQQAEAMAMAKGTYEKLAAYMRKLCGKPKVTWDHIKKNVQDLLWRPGTPGGVTGILKKIANGENKERVFQEETYGRVLNWRRFLIPQYGDALVPQISEKNPDDNPWASYFLDWARAVPTPPRY